MNLRLINRFVEAKVEYERAWLAFHGYDERYLGLHLQQALSLESLNTAARIVGAEIKTDTRIDENEELFFKYRGVKFFTILESGRELVDVTKEVA